MTLIPSKFLVCVVSMAVLIPVLPTLAQTPESTIIPGVVEPLELPGEPQGSTPALRNCGL